MIISIDMDGVMLDDDRYRLDYISKLLFETDHRLMDRPYFYEEKCSFWEVKEENRIYDPIYFEYIRNAEPNRFVSEITHKMHEDGHILKVITGRHYGDYADERGEYVRKESENWLIKNNIYYDKLVFSGFPKIKSFKEEGSELIIEDFPKTIATCSEFCPVFMYDTISNRGFEHDNVTRVYSWYDLYQKLINISCL